MSIERLILIISLILLIGLGGLWWWWQSSTNPNLDEIRQPKITSFEFNNETDQFKVVTDSGSPQADSIDRVSVLAYLKENKEINLGDMIKVENEGIAGVWFLDKPVEPLEIIIITAVIYNEAGLELDRLDWLTRGQSDIYNELWLESPSAEIKLSIGQMAQFENLEIKLIDIPQDSRCAEETNCLISGFVVADLEIFLAGTSVGAIGLRSDEGERQIGNYEISLVEVAPEKTKDQILSISDYELVFNLSRLIN